MVVVPLVLLNPAGTVTLQSVQLPVLRSVEMEEESGRKSVMMEMQEMEEDVLRTV